MSKPTRVTFHLPVGDINSRVPEETVLCVGDAIRLGSFCVEKVESRKKSDYYSDGVFIVTRVESDEVWALFPIKGEADYAEPYPWNKWHGKDVVRPTQESPEIVFVLCVRSIEDGAPKYWQYERPAPFLPRAGDLIAISEESSTPVKSVTWHVDRIVAMCVDRMTWEFEQKMTAEEIAGLPNYGWVLCDKP